ncbi:hypothetical protein J3A83DRAFT_4366923 [Scleroderma citrinum]
MAYGTPTKFPDWATILVVISVFVAFVLTFWAVLHIGSRFCRPSPLRDPEAHRQPWHGPFSSTSEPTPPPPAYVRSFPPPPYARKENVTRPQTSASDEGPIGSEPPSYLYSAVMRRG